MQDAEKTFTSIAAKSLQIPQSAVEGSLSAHDAPTWDSFNFLTLISSLEEEFKVSFDMGEVATFQTLTDVRESLKRKGVALN